MSQAIHSLSNRIPSLPLCFRPAVEGARQCETVGRAADEQGRLVVGEAERRDQPDAVQRVVADARVARARELSARGRGDSQAGKQAVSPVPARVGRDREADVPRAAAREARDLERGDDRRAPREAVRLGLGRMHRAAAVVRITRDQAGDGLAVGADLVGRVRGDEVGAAPARDAVTAAARDVDPVVSGACADPVRFRRTEQEVGSRAADDQRCACGNGEKKREPRRRQQGGPLHRVPPLPSRSGAMDGYR